VQQVVPWKKLGLDLVWQAILEWAVHRPAAGAPPADISAFIKGSWPSAASIRDKLAGPKTRHGPSFKRLERAVKNLDCLGPAASILQSWIKFKYLPIPMTKLTQAYERPSTPPAEEEDSDETEDSDDAEPAAEAPASATEAAPSKKRRTIK